MSTPMGNATIGENLLAAEASGRLVRRPDGLWQLPPLTGARVWVRSAPPPVHDCPTLMRYLFLAAYGSSAVPWGCRECFKVKILPRTLRHLMAAHQLAQSSGLGFKCGTEIDVTCSDSRYGAYFYFRGLADARAAYKILRTAIDAHPKLGPDVNMVIKRGCTDYEMACGPSDQWTFREDLPHLEATLLARFHAVPRPAESGMDQAMTKMGWIHTAYRIGDETYLDFTGGRRLYPATVTYDPDPS